MTQEEYNRSIETGKLQLNAWGKLSYFFLAGFLFFIAIALSSIYVFANSANPDMSLIWVSIILGILGLLLYRYQQIGLKFQIAETRLTRDELFKFIKKIEEELECLIIFSEGNIFVAKTNNGYSLWTKCKQITILFDRNRVLINSIYDPVGKSGVDLFGQNKQLVMDIINGIKKAEKDKAP
ncbi:MAG TPA: hypothetical protein VGI43_06735 [Mucilaginibacter sp.]|jgi:hypothetical protein